jgi:hypothetical protein
MDALPLPDALAETYGGGLDQTTMNLLVSSTHPAGAGVQSALVEVLLDHRAAINGLADNGSPILTAIAFDYQDAAETLARRGARLDGIIAAAAMGRVDLVTQMMTPDGSLRPEVSLAGPSWLNVARDPRAHLAHAIVVAAKFGRTDVVALLLRRNVDPGAADQDDMTALHWAAGNCHRDIVDLLLEHGAPLEVRNTWGGTVLDSTVYFAQQNPKHEADYLPVIERLIAAGAKVQPVNPFPAGLASIDDLLRRHGR